MARICTVCAHKRRHEIDQLLVTGQGSERGIAKQFGLSASAVHNHKHEHLPKLLGVVARRIGELDAEQLMGSAVEVYERALQLLAEAESAAHRAKLSDSPTTHDKAMRTVVTALREVRGSVELLAKMNVEVREQTDHDIAVEHARIDIAEELARRLHVRNASQDDRPVSQDDASQRFTDMRALPAPRIDEVVDAELVEDQA